LAKVFYLQAVHAAAIVLLEAPSGYFADDFFWFDHFGFIKSVAEDSGTLLGGVLAMWSALKVTRYCV
jgi:hypothetical protein